jgi:chromosome segregation ATPase
MDTLKEEAGQIKVNLENELTTLHQQVQHFADQLRDTKLEYATVLKEYGDTQSYLYCNTDILDNVNHTYTELKENVHHIQNEYQELLRENIQKKEIMKDLSQKFDMLNTNHVEELKDIETGMIDTISNGVDPLIKELEQFKKHMTEYLICKEKAPEVQVEGLSKALEQFLWQLGTEVENVSDLRSQLEKKKEECSVVSAKADSLQEEAIKLQADTQAKEENLNQMINDRDVKINEMEIYQAGLLDSLTEKETALEFCSHTEDIMLNALQEKEERNSNLDKTLRELAKQTDIERSLVSNLQSRLEELSSDSNTQHQDCAISVKAIDEENKSFLKEHGAFSKVLVTKVKEKLYDILEKEVNLAGDRSVKEKKLKELSSCQAELLSSLRDKEEDLDSVSSALFCSTANLEYWKSKSSDVSSVYIDINAQLQRETSLVKELESKIYELSSFGSHEKSEYDNKTSESPILVKNFLVDFQTHKGETIKKFREFISSAVDKESKLLEGIKSKNDLLEEKSAVLDKYDKEISHLRSELNKLTDDITEKNNENESLAIRVELLQKADDERTLEMTMLELNCKDKDDKIKMLETNAFESSMLFEEKNNELFQANNDMDTLKEEAGQIKVNLENELTTLHQQVQHFADQLRDTKLEYATVLKE